MKALASVSHEAAVAGTAALEYMGCWYIGCWYWGAAWGSGAGAASEEEEPLNMDYEREKKSDHKREGG